MDARNGFSAVSLGQLQRNDDDVFAGAGVVTRIRCRRKRGRRGSELRSSTTASATSVLSPRFSFTSIRRRGLIFAVNATSTPIISRIRSSPRKYTAASAWTWPRSFPITAIVLWGITASDSARGYVAWGGPPATGPIDGTVVPCAAGGSLPFLAAASRARAGNDQESLRTARLDAIWFRRCV